MTTYGFLLFDDAEELDVVGPWEVITASSMLCVSQGGEQDTTVMVPSDPSRFAAPRAWV